MARGFSLIEVLVMGTIVAVALLGAATLYPVSQTQMYRAADLSRANAIARGRLELVKSKGFPVAPADCQPTDTTTYPGYVVNCSQRDGTLDGLPANTAVVTILVGWQGPPSGSVWMSALVMRPEQ